MTEFQRLTDVSGCMWWWPYGKSAKRGQVIRGLFECGYAPGTFISLFTSEFLGLRYDAPTRRLHFRPFNPCQRFHLGRFSAGRRQLQRFVPASTGLIAAEVVNHNPHAVTATVELILPEKASRLGTEGWRSTRPALGQGKFLGRNTIRVSQDAAGQQIVVSVASGTK